MRDITINAAWTTDCCGKQDLDFSFINANTRYYPDFSAICEIVFLDNFCHNRRCGEDWDGYVESDYKPVSLAISSIIRGANEADVKQKVNQWYNDNICSAIDKAKELIKIDFNLQ